MELSDKERLFLLKLVNIEIEAAKRASATVERRAMLYTIQAKLKQSKP